ncbi:MAG: ABC transporter substrate-binding protein [Betaproteobacteria bacterium]
MKRVSGFLACSAASLALSVAAHAGEIKVGFISTLSGPVSSLGIPYARGMEAGISFRSEVNGNKIRLITLDDASDPSTATRNARKLIDEEKVDVLIGVASTPSTMAVAGLSRETKTPMIAFSPVGLPGDAGAWIVTTAQPVPLMIDALVEDMKKRNIKTVAYIGFSDSWGDFVYDGLTKSAGAAGIKVLTNERYARTDSSVAGQVLKLIASRPDAIVTGVSGTPGALPFLSLAERGYKGQLYGLHSMINADFVRVAGASADGLIAPTGPVIVAEQLPENYPTRKMAMDFRAAFQATHNAPTKDPFSAYAFDAMLVLVNAMERVPASIKPATPEYRTALRDAIYSTKNLVGTHGVYTFKPGDTYGVDARARVLVKLDKGVWVYQH